MSSRPSDPSENDEERIEESVDPRVQIELERLNAATDDINKLELDLDEARAGFRQLLCESTLRIDGLARKLGACVEKARPYYEARIKAKEALHETHLAAIRFERANSAHAAAKEMVYLAEEGLCTEGRIFDHAWQEMLNHATMRVNESELERTLSEAEHRKTSHCYQRAEIRVQQLQKDLKRSITKSRYENLKLRWIEVTGVAQMHQMEKPSSFLILLVQQLLVLRLPLSLSLQIVGQILKLLLLLQPVLLLLLPLALRILNLKTSSFSCQISLALRLHLLYLKRNA